MRVAVVTPYYKESTEVLRRCHDSVKRQTYPDIQHIFVSDGFPNDEIDGWDAVHIRGPHHNDVGSTPRAIGAMSASTLGAGALVMLDADNWYDPDHVQAMVDTQRQSNALVVTATRTLWGIEGARLGVCRESDGEKFNDTNCYFVLKPAFPLLPAWVYGASEEGHVGDRMFWAAVKASNVPRAHCVKPTVNYVTRYAGHYLVNDQVPPPDSHVLIMKPGRSGCETISYAEYQARVAAGHPYINP